MKILLASYEGEQTSELPELGEPVLPAFPFGNAQGLFRGLGDFRLCGRAVVSEDVVTVDEYVELSEAYCGYLPGIPEDDLVEIAARTCEIISELKPGTPVRVLGTSTCIQLQTTEDCKFIGNIELKEYK